MTPLIYLLLFGIKQLSSNNGKRHSKLFTNFHVSWDTLYVSDLYTICMDYRLYKYYILPQLE